MIVICDIDGTAANINHRRHWVENKPKRWDKFYDEMVDDTPNAWCQELIRSLQKHDIVFVSGRPETHRIQTEEWLNKYYGGLYSYLYMRPANNTEPDYTIKERIYNEHFASKDVLFVIDDRRQVVDMWREKGLVVLQCDNGDF